MRQFINALVVREFLETYGIHIIEWPLYSLDLNPIEHLWWALKRLLYKQYPQITTISYTKEDWDQFTEALKDCWRRIPSRLIEKLILGMPRRLNACRQARGYQTRY